MTPIHKRLKSFGDAFRGIYRLIQTQVNARIHFFITLGVLILGFIYNLSNGEWLAIFLAMGLVWSGEAFNTAIEALVDEVHPEYHEKAGRIKDVAAGGVLIAAIFAAIIGLVIFVPKIF